MNLSINQNSYVEFLQWALPHLNMKWSGFRKVHQQVDKRLRRRLEQLDIDTLDDYRHYLNDYPDEWKILDQLCRISISRFYRDIAVLQTIESETLPALAEAEIHNPAHGIRIWCAGCASGEEPYTLKLLWEFAIAADFPEIELKIIATDIDPALLDRAEVACYSFSSVKRLPSAWLQQGFDVENNEYCLKKKFRNNVIFRHHDIREAFDEERFHLVFCRNLVFTYFDDKLQQVILKKIWTCLHDNGYLVIGVHEKLPVNALFQQHPHRRELFRKLCAS